MQSHILIVTGIVALGCLVLVQANQYEQQQTYNDGYEQPSMGYQMQPKQYKQQSYQPAQTYSAPSYPKYQAPSSAHHSQYDNYYPKQSQYEQSYSKPQYAPMPQVYQQQQQPYPARGPTGYPSAPSANQYSMGASEEY